jgi:hypothetical protein
MSRLLFRHVARRWFSTETAITLPRPLDGERVISGMPQEKAARRVRIYSPCHFVGQEKVQTKGWQLEPEGNPERFNNPLMGWTSNPDTSEQAKIQVWFETVEEAVQYCKSQGLEYFIEKTNEPTFKVKAYSDVFKFKKIQPDF